VALVSRYLQVVTGFEVATLLLNGAAAARIGHAGQLDAAVTLVVEDGRARIYAIFNPNMLGRLGKAVELRR
jgi:hypothetical protein